MTKLEWLRAKLDDYGQTTAEMDTWLPVRKAEREVYAELYMAEYGKCLAAELDGYTFDEIG